MADVQETAQPERMCASCGEQPAGPGRVLCAACKMRIAQARPFYWDDPAASGADDAVDEAAGAEVDEQAQARG